MKEKNKKLNQFNQNIVSDSNLSDTNNPIQKVPLETNPSSVNLHKLSRGRILSIIGAIAGLIMIILLIGGGAALAGRVWDPEWNPFRQKADKEVPIFYKSFFGT